MKISAGSKREYPETEVSTFNPLYFWPLLKMGGLPRLSDNSGVVEEQLLFTTISPAFAIGWFVYVLNVLCGPGQIDMQKGQLTQHERAGLLTQ